MTRSAWHRASGRRLQTLAIGPLVIAATLVGVLGGPVAGSDEALEAVNVLPGEATTEAKPHDARFLRLADGTARTLPMGLVPELARDLRFSPDRRRLAYVGLGADDPLGGPARLWVVDVDGEGRRAISPSGVIPDDPAWSPDGRSIVYVDDDGLTIVDVASGRDRRLRGVRGSRLWLPTYRPDGRAILYTRVADHGWRLELWVAPLRGGPPRRFLRDAAFGAWSPDGSTVAYRSFGRAVEQGSIWPYRWGGVYLADKDARHARPVVRARGSMMAPLDWSPVRPEWSPDGTRLVYARDNPGVDTSIQVLELMTHHVTHVGYGSWPSWWDDRTLLLEGYRFCCSTPAREAVLTDEVTRE